ncbi:MAG: HlyD family efflux transporter periplasmic adaptor subunit [Candidatus Faecousia sp.]|nr:HlyD family efflux transporter periplasmic adaptor subunit [Candidatus Faecousia sp.]
MDKTKKKSVKRYILWGVLALAVLWLALMPLMARQQQTEDGPQASILSANATVSSIQSAIHGGGTLEAGEPEDITIPKDVKITEFLVKNGDMVSEGDALAAVDKVSVMTAITEIWDSMSTVEKQMESYSNEKAATEVSAAAGGRVKLVYAREGDRVESVMLEHGALAVLSLDSKLCVRLTAGSDLATGETVTVTLADGKKVTGRVESNLSGELVVTIADKGYAVGQTVSVAGVGTGELEIHSPWNATAFAGTVSTVYAQPEQTLNSGAALFTLKDTDYTAQREILAKTHREYEELLQKLFKMYETGVISAPCDGMVSGIDKDSTHLLAAQAEEIAAQPLTAGEGEFRLVLLSGDVICTVNDDCPLENGDPNHNPACPHACNKSDNCPATTAHFDGCPHKCTMQVGCEAKYHQEGCPEQCTGNNSCQVTEPSKHLDYCPRRCTNAKGCQAIHHKDGCPEKCTKNENCQASIDNHLPSCPKYCSCSETCTAIEHRDGCPKIVVKEYRGVVGIVTRVEPTGNVIYLAVNSADFGTVTYTNKWDFGTLNVHNPSGAVPSDTPYTVGDASAYTQGDVVVIAYADDGTYQIVKTGNKAAVSGGGMGNLDLSGLMGGMPSFSFNFSMPSMGGGTSSQTQLYDLNGDTLMTVTPQDTMTLTVSVDESDISSVKTGMTAEITVNALPDEVFEGEITKVAMNGSGNGGSSKFAVEITLPRQSDMLSGMSASAVISLYEKMDVLTLPAAALSEDGAKTIVYTALDQKTGEPANPVEVTTGLSDGETVEILSGLQSGDSVYYYYYDTLEESDAVETDRLQMR